MKNFGRADKQTDADPAAKEAATARTEAEAEKNRERAARALELAESRHLAAIADPDMSGEALAALRRDRDAKQEELESCEREVVRAKKATREAAARHEAAALTAQWAAVNAETGAALGRVEQALRAVPAEWSRYAAAFAKARAFGAELEKFRRRFPDVTVAAPPTDGNLFTPDVLRIAQSVGPALATLAVVRAERAHPAPAPPVQGPGFFVPHGSRRRPGRATTSKSPPAWVDEPLRDYVRSLPCVVPRCPRPPEACHVKTKRLGHDRRNLYPACHLHHAEQHQHGIRTFEAKYGLDLADVAAAVTAAFDLGPRRDLPF